MCNFFSFVTDPINHPAEYYFFDWVYRKANLEDDGVDSHSHICARFKLDEDVCNKYEFNPLTKAFTVDQINSNRDDSEAAEKWANRQDFKEIVEPLIIKPIVNPFGLPKVEQVTDEQIGWLKEWASVRDSVGSSVMASVRDAVRDAVWDSVRDLVGASVWDSVGSSVWAYFWTSVANFIGCHWGTEKPILDITKLYDNGEWDERIAASGCKKIGLDEIAQVLKPYGVEVVDGRHRNLR